LKVREVLKDVEKLQGIELKSIKRGAEIVVEKLDWEASRIVIRTVSGTLRSRPFSEIEKLWEALCTKPAIHVDSELGGSGTSRNQPETLLGNLPYIEWFRNNRRKHLAYVKRSSHDYGTLKCMDDLNADKYRLDLNSVAENKSTYSKITQIVIVSSEIKDHSDVIEDATGVKGKALQPGIYEFSTSSLMLLLVSVEATSNSIEPGTYIVMSTYPPTRLGSKAVQIGEKRYTLQTSNGLCVLFDTDKNQISN
jgi:hypothetical protein